MRVSARRKPWSGSEGRAFASVPWRDGLAFSPPVVFRRRRRLFGPLASRADHHARARARRRCLARGCVGDAQPDSAPAHSGDRRKTPKYEDDGWWHPFGCRRGAAGGCRRPPVIHGTAKGIAETFLFGVAYEALVQVSQQPLLMCLVPDVQRTAIVSTHGARHQPSLLHHVLILLFSGSLPGDAAQFFLPPGDELIEGIVIGGCHAGLLCQVRHKSSNRDSASASSAIARPYRRMVGARCASQSASVSEPVRAWRADVAARAAVS